jgi:DNA-directed RNA polymerase specialized sigma24 family protein
VSSLRANYRPEEVRQLIEEYAGYQAMADTSRRGLRYLVLLADLNGALDQLPLKYWEVTLLVGLLGVPEQEAAVMLKIKQQTVSKRYRQALGEIHYLINGCG